jgi:predicted DNA-binding protein
MALAVYCLLRYNIPMRKAFSFRLPEATAKQLADLAKETGMTQTQTIIMAIAFYATQVKKGK